MGGKTHYHAVYAHQQHVITYRVIKTEFLISEYSESINQHQL